MMGSSGCGSFWCQGGMGFTLVFCALVLAYMYVVIHDSGRPSLMGSTTTTTANKARTAAEAEGVVGVEIPAQVLQDLMLSIREAKARIWQTWDVDHYPLFLGLMHVPSASWELQKAKFIELLLEAQRAKASGGARRALVVGFSGSSVTAGHDSFFAEAFPSVFNDTLRAVLERHPGLHVGLEVRNHAFGNNPCLPYAHCLETHMGADLDLLAWEQSLNCGHDPRPVEAFLRAAARMPRKPPVLFLASGTPYWPATECANASRPDLPGPRSPPPDEAALLRLPLEEALTSRDLLRNMTFLDVRARGGVVLSLAALYRASAPMGQSLMSLEAYKCMGPYGANFSAKTPGGGSTWHPGRRGHQLRGENLAFVVLSMLEAAAKALLAQGAAQAAREASAALTLHGAGAPARPVVCAPEECGSGAACFTDFSPRMQGALSSLLVGGPASLAPNNWTLALSFLDQPAIRKAEARGLGYLDRKVIFTSGSAHKPLSLHISPRRPGRGFLLLCEVQKGFAQYPAGMGDLDRAAAVVLFEDALDDAGNRQHWQRGDEAQRRAKAVHLQLTHHADQCYRTEPIVGPGNHVLSIAQRTEGVRINIAYVVYW